jgi:hypothetical protein
VTHYWHPARFRYAFGVLVQFVNCIVAIVRVAPLLSLSVARIASFPR